MLAAVVAVDVVNAPLSSSLVMGASSSLVMVMYNKSVKTCSSSWSMALAAVMIAEAVLLSSWMSVSSSSLIVRHDKVSKCDPTLGQGL